MSTNQVFLDIVSKFGYDIGNQSIEQIIKLVHLSKNPILCNILAHYIDSLDYDQSGLKCISKLQYRLLRLLKEFKRICDSLNLKWFANSGTLIGAIRNHGFIPWDDDIDVIMPASDYDILMKNHTMFSYPFFLQNSLTEHKVDWDKFRPHAQLRDSSTTGFIQTDKDKPINKGIFLDIFKLVEVSPGKLRSYPWKPKFLLDKSVYDLAATIEFEDVDINIPVEFEQILTAEYGDWRTPKQSQSSHGKIELNLSIPYFEYCKMKGIAYA